MERWEKLVESREDYTTREVKLTYKNFTCFSNMPKVWLCLNPGVMRSVRNR